MFTCHIYLYYKISTGPVEKRKKKSLRNLKKENHEVKGNVKYSQTNI